MQQADLVVQVAQAQQTQATVQAAEIAPLLVAVAV
jgi:hypothetical protein